jgi:CRP-like cAMP-binding protein
MKNNELDEFIGPRSTRVNSSYASQILNVLSPYIEFKTYKKGQRFTISASQCTRCYLVRSGRLSMHRQPDDILIEYFEAPTLRGITQIPSDSKSIYVVKVEAVSEIAVMELEKFYALLSDYNLWEAFSKHLQQMPAMAAEVIFKLSHPSAYEIVRLQLYELLAKPDEVRESISAESYIRSKSRISRSSVMRILSDLRTAGCITMDNGILKAIDHIPLKP